MDFGLGGARECIIDLEAFLQADFKNRKTIIAACVQQLRSIMHWEYNVNEHGYSSQGIEVMHRQTFVIHRSFQPNIVKLSTTSEAPVMACPDVGTFNNLSPITAKGIVKLSPMVTTTGVVFNMART